MHHYHVFIVILATSLSLILATTSISKINTNNNNNNNNNKFISLKLSKKENDSGENNRQQNRRVRRLNNRYKRNLKGFKDYQTLWREPDDVYYTDINIGTGTDRQKFSVIVDTGSSTIAVPCKGCGNCGSQHNHFDRLKSPSAVATSKQYSQCYGEGSCNTGTTLTDKICIGTTCPESESASIEFGCCSSYAPNFKDQKADGIIGIAHGNTLIKKLQEQHSLEKYQFALCLGRKDGTISVGGYEASRHAEPIAWTPIHYRSIFYAVAVDKMIVGEKEISMPGTYTKPFFDAGTSYTFVPLEIFNKIKAGFDEFCRIYGNCKHVGSRNPSGTMSIDRTTSIGCYKKLDDAKKDTFPDISFEFPGGASLCIPPRAYFFEYENNRISCVGINRDADFTFGANVMVDHNIVYDIDGARVGLAISKCDHDSTGIELARCRRHAKSTTPSPSKPSANSDSDSDSSSSPSAAAASTPQAEQTKSVTDETSTTTKVSPSITPLHMSFYTALILCILAPLFTIFERLFKKYVAPKCCCRGG